MYKLAICDDEQPFRKMIRTLLYQYQKQSHISFQIIEAVDGQHLLNLLMNNSIDILFLDIKMQRLNGIEAAKQLRLKNESIQIVFMTSAPEFALEGYKVDAFDYLVKPIHYPQFAKMMDKLLKRMEKSMDYIIAKNYENIHKLRLNTIFYVETWERKLLIHTQQGNFISHERMKELESNISRKGFYRCNSGYLVNFVFVDRIDGQNNLLYLVNGETIPVSRSRKKECIAALTEFWGDNL